MLDFDWGMPEWKPLTSCAGGCRCRGTPTCGRRGRAALMGEPLIKAMCPPNYPTMADAVDAVVAEKFGPDGIYPDEGCSRASTRASSAPAT